MRVSGGLEMLEVVMERHFAFYGYLIGGNTPLEKVRQFLHVLEFHESEGILRTKRRCDTERFEAAVGDVLQVFPHVGGRKAADAKTQYVLRERHFAFHGVLQHGGDPIFHVLVKKARLLLPDRAAHLESKLNVRAFVAEDPVGARCKPVQQAALPKEIDVSECREKEQPFDATRKANQVEKEIAAVLKSANLGELVD